MQLIHSGAMQRDVSSTYGVPHDDIIFNEVHWPDQWDLIVHKIVTIVKLDFKQASKSCMHITTMQKHACIALHNKEKLLVSSKNFLLEVNWWSLLTITTAK
jgi:hypothetical protein